MKKFTVNVFLIVILIVFNQCFGMKNLKKVFLQVRVNPPLAARRPIVSFASLKSFNVGLQEKNKGLEYSDQKNVAFNHKFSERVNNLLCNAVVEGSVEKIQGILGMHKNLFDEYNELYKALACCDYEDPEACAKLEGLLNKGVNPNGYSLSDSMNPLKIVVFMIQQACEKYHGDELERVKKSYEFIKKLLIDAGVRTESPLEVVRRCKGSCPPEEELLLKFGAYGDECCKE